MGKVRRWIPAMPVLLQQTRSDPGVLQGHRVQEAQLSQLSYDGRICNCTMSRKKKKNSGDQISKWTQHDRHLMKRKWPVLLYKNESSCQLEIENGASFTP